MSVDVSIYDITHANVFRGRGKSMVHLYSGDRELATLFVTPAQADAIAAVFAPVEPVEVEGHPA